MATFSGAVLRINRMLWSWRTKANKYLLSKYSGEKTGISIISQNCTGGIVMHEFNIKFMTPTVNYYMSMPDFVSFCENLSNNLKIELKETNERGANNCPVAKLGDYRLVAVHYHSFDEFKSAWERRSKRVNLNRILIIMTDRDGFSDDLLPRIAKLPYKKVLFSHIDYPEYDFVCKLPGYENADCVGSASDFKGLTGKRMYSYFNFRRCFDDLMRENV